MSLDVVYGESRDRESARRLAQALKPVVADGTIYLAYPVLATADEKVQVDALLVSREHGLVAFLIAGDQPTTAEDWKRHVDAQDRLYSTLVASLRRHEGLRSGRQLAAEPQTATVFAAPVAAPDGVDGWYGDFTEISSFVAGLDGIEPEVKHNLEAALQRVATIKPAKKRAGVNTSSSRGAVLKEIEKGIANLDRWQKAAAIESPEGPQRIRGLAGSGKTVVLALKAAYWHAQHPDWNIAVTFHTRALYQQIADLVTRFTFEHAADQPDFEHLRIMHSWGSPGRTGIYSLIAMALGETPRDYAYARGKYGMEDAFRGVCAELLDIARNENVRQIFDAVLIDEAQDLPPEFFQLVYLFTKDPKRIVWGYDEFQKLSEAAMPSTEELFGTGADGASVISLDAPEDAPRRDIVLPVCYRNTPWALVTAHALGIGVYREPDGLLQHPDDPKLWKDVGYDVINGSLQPGGPVTLARRPDSSPEYFDRYLRPEDAVVIRSFDDESSQDQWIAEQIHTNITEDELELDDILIVLPDTYRSKSRGPRIMRELRRKNIKSHLVGVTTSQDAVFRPDSVAIAHIFRAKGNEAPMVYVLDAQYGAAQFNRVSRRNTIFTAITRSRAWVRITGWGDDMTTICNETRKIIDNQYRLSFTVPTDVELQRLRHVHRGRSVRDEEKVRKATEGITTFLEAVEKGELGLYDIPPALRTQLARSLQEDAADFDE
ncbi:hypothetical protein Acy02nite_47140 [Actinoplanes cyaneus]|uniref:UvrD-like helicase C-terminal domain-containing protein n=1 Tax=Actinoplanes cyaneus TaxID=52696 RepID=A0A919M720_9ACTN|nr:ATP-binding domain-containing protein [Actinoplanes cyaneus]MCW2138831.1 Superfamily I DNA and RNA helicases [Actinoplanes cyaneus]GID66833.1 hypothetical protein Acy02nite_47140 [Actinoplanes cyaneus]